MNAIYYDRSGSQLVQAGSIVLCDSPDIVGKAIRAGEWLKWRGGCKWNHTVIAIETGYNPKVIQASIDGVTDTATLSALEGGAILIVPPPIALDVKAAIAFANQEVGADYGWLTLAGVVIDQLLPRCFRFQIGRYGSWICSALVAEAWRAGGWLNVWPDIYSVAPAQLALAVGIEESEVYRNPKHKRSSI